MFGPFVPIAPPKLQKILGLSVYIVHFMLVFLRIKRSARFVGGRGLYLPYGASQPPSFHIDPHNLSKTNQKYIADPLYMVLPQIEYWLNVSFWKQKPRSEMHGILLRWGPWSLPAPTLLKWGPCFLLLVATLQTIYSSLVFQRRPILHGENRRWPHCSDVSAAIETE